MLYENFRQIIKIGMWTLVGLAVAGCVMLGIFWATHGWLTLTTPAGVSIKELAYCETVCANPETSNDSRLLVPKGEYSLQITGDNGANYIANVTVGGFFATTTVNAKLARYDTSGLTVNPEQYFFPVSGGYFSYEPDATSYTDTSGTSFDTEGFAGVGYVGNNTLLLVETSYVNMSNPEKSQRVFAYNTESHVVTTVGTTSGVLVVPESIIYGSNALYVLNTSLSPAKLLTMTASGVSVRDIPDTVSYSAADDNTPVFTANGDAIAFTSATNTTTRLHVYSLKDFSQISQFDLSSNTDIYGLSLSPDGSSIITIAVEQPSMLYDAKNGTKLMQLPIGTARQWLDNDSFIYQLDADRNSPTIGRLFVGSAKKKELYGVVDTALLTVYDTSVVISNKLYFTGVPKETDDSQSGVAAFVVDLSKEASGRASTADTIVSSLPYSGMAYSIGYHYDTNAQLVLDIRAGSGARNAAVNKIAGLGFDPGDYTIRFSDYTTPFTDQTGGKQ